MVESPPVVSDAIRPRHRGYLVAAVVLVVVLAVAVVLAYRITRPPSFEPLPVPSVSLI